MNKLVSIKIPVLNAFDDMGIDITKDVTTFTRWAVDAENEIASYYSFRKKIEVLKVKNCVAELPCDAAFVQYVLLGDHGCDCVDLFTKCSLNFNFLAASVTDTFLTIDSSGSENGIVLGGPKWEAQDGNLIFTQNYNNQYVTVQYLGLQSDDDGFPMVGENHLLAIVEYIMYKFCVRSRFSPIKMTFEDIKLHKTEWENLCVGARADDAKLSDTDRQEIVAMIHDPWIGHGFEVGMYTRDDY